MLRYPMSLFDRLFRKKKVTVLEPASDLPRPADYPVDWTNSEIHLMLLSRFLSPNCAADGVPAYWESALGEPPPTTVNRYIQNGLLVPIPLRSKVAYGNNIPDLKKLLKERGLKVGGNKTELLNRLMDADEHGMAERYKADTMFECSSEIRPRILEYSTDKKREFDDAIAEALAALRFKDLAKASRTIDAYESKQLHLEKLNPLAITQPPRETATDVEELKTIFTLRPKILSELAEDEWQPLHIVAALSHLLHGRVSHSWFPQGFMGVVKFDLATTVRMMQCHIRHFYDIKRMSSIGITQGRVLSAGTNAGSCKACMKIADKLYNLDSFPELPYEKCTCAMGCRCAIVAKIPGL